MKNKMVMIQTCCLQKLFGFTAKKCDPAYIPWGVFVSGMYNGALGKDEESVAFF